MNDQPENSTSRDASTWQSIATDKAIILAFITGSGYLIGYAYFRSYYEGLGLPSYILNIPTLEIFYTAMFYFLLMLMLIMPLGNFFTKKPETFLHAAVGNIYLIVTLAISLYMGIKSNKFLLYFVSIFVLITIISLCRKRYSLMHTLSTLKVGSEIAVFIVVVWVAFQFSNFLGSEHATRVIEGKMLNVPIVTFYKNNEKILSNPEAYRMILFDQNGYYLVKVQTPAPKSPTILFIPKSDSLRVEFRASE